MLGPSPIFVLNQFAAQPHVDVVHSTSHGSTLIYESIHSSVHERLDEFPQTAPLLGLVCRPSTSRLDSTCAASVSNLPSISSASSSSGVSIESCRCGRSPKEYQRHHLPVDPQMREVSWSATPETSDQRLGLDTSTCLATRRDSVCASSNPTSLPRDSWRVSPLYKPCAA